MPSSKSKGKGKGKATRVKPPPPAPPPHSFQFINLGEDGQISRDDDRSVIREVVMTNYHNRIKRQRISPKETLGESSATNVLISPQLNVFQLKDNGLVIESPTNQLFELCESRRHNGEPSLGKPNLHDDSGDDDPSVSTRLRSNPPAGASLQQNKIPIVNNMLLSKKKDEGDVQRLFESLDLFPGCLISFPTNATARSKFLIDSFFQDRDLTSLLMMGVRKSWFRASLQDVAFFQVMLAHYVACISLRTKVGDPLEALALRMEANRIVNERLSSWEGISDGTIAAVASLLLYEANNGTIEATKTHMVGLSRMVKLRGGFHNAQFPPAVQRQIAWAEISTSNLLSAPPMIITFSAPSLVLPAYKCTAAPRGPFAGASFCTGDYKVDFSVISTDVAAIFNDLRFLTGVREARAPRSIRESDSMWLSDKVYMVQRNLNCLTLKGDEDDIPLLDKACCGAASLFSHVYLRDLGFYPGIVRIVVSKFKESLMTVVDGIVGNLDEIEEGDTTKLLWVLVVAGISALGKPERGWFVEKLSELCAVEPGWSKETARKAFEQILWTKEWDGHFDKLWEKAFPQRNG